MMLGGLISSSIAVGAISVIDPKLSSRFHDQILLSALRSVVRIELGTHSSSFQALIILVSRFGILVLIL